MTILNKIEEYRRELSEKLNFQQGSYGLFLEVHDFFNLIYQHSERVPSGVYYTEFIRPYRSLLKHVTVFGRVPGQSKKLIDELIQFSDEAEFQPYRSTLLSEVGRLQSELDTLNRFLRGEDDEDYYPEKFCFPLIETDVSGALTEYGFLETVEVMVQEADELIFIIDPSELQRDQHLEQQIERSWAAAKSILAKYKDVRDNHKVGIQFDRRLMYYAGNSLGAALTFAFAEALLRYYNLTHELSVVPGTVMTGGVGENLELLPVGAVSIRIKVKTAFFSPVKIITLPAEDQTAAEKELAALREEYPERELGLAAASDIQVFMNRRDIIDLKKQRVSTRVLKTLKRHYAAVVIIFLLLSFSAFYYFYTYDDNPSFHSLDESHIVIYNAQGSELWRVFVGKITPKHYRNYQKKSMVILDVNNDGENEVVMTMVAKPEYNGPEFSTHKILCLNKDREILWQYEPNDTASAPQEPSEYPFFLMFLDTTTIDSVPVGFFTGRAINFPSIIFALDLRTGKRLPGVFWHNGHINHGLINDYNNDGKKELLGNAINNGYEAAALFSIDIDKLSGQAPGPDLYTFYNIPPAEFNFYMLVSKTDLHYVYKNRFNIPHNFAYNVFPYSLYIYIQESPTDNMMTNVKGYLLNIDFSDKPYQYGIQISESLRMYRDTLVAKGVLLPPYTDTPEYKEQILDSYRYYYKGGWVTPDDWRRYQTYFPDSLLSSKDNENQEKY